MTTTRARWIGLLLMFVSGGVALAGPTVVPTAEGQVGEPLGVDDAFVGTRFESVRGDAGDVMLGNFTTFGGSPPQVPEFQFLTDMIHGYPEPVPIDSSPAIFVDVDKQAPASAWSRNAADDGDFVAFSFAVDGAMPETITVRIAAFDETGSSLQSTEVPNIPTVPFPDPSFSKTGVAVDNQGRVTVTYTELPAGMARVVGRRFDSTGSPLPGSPFVIQNNVGHSDVALLDPAGNRLIVATTDFGTIRGNLVDTTGPTPMVLPSFPLNTTPATFAHTNPVIAANPSVGNGLAVWEDLTGVVGDPVNIRARRFDAMGNPVGNDFIVNTTTAESQGQAAVTFDPDSGASAVVWAGDGANLPTDALDVFLQVYDADGNPIGGEVKVNTSTPETQDRPAVRFLPERDPQGRPQVAVLWRDVGMPDGTQPNGTGTSYKCFSIEGLGDPGPIFADGFESGDTSSWSDTQP